MRTRSATPDPVPLEHMVCICEECGHLRGRQLTAQRCAELHAIPYPNHTVHVLPASEGLRLYFRLQWELVASIAACRPGLTTGLL
jgi:hypothetical protein